MKLFLLNELCLRDLKNSIEKKNYVNDEPFASSYLKEKGRENYLEELPYDFNDFKLINSNDPKDDAKNSKILFESLRNLPLIYARNEKLWTYLTHFVFWDYMQARWGERSTDIVSRYFFKGKQDDRTIGLSSIPYTRNGIGRLWWGAYVVYDSNLKENPYEFLEELFSSQDLFVGICERSISKNKRLTTSILKTYRKYKLQNMKNSKRIVREVLKEINFVSTITIFDILSNDEIDVIVENIFKEKIEYCKDL